MPELRQEYLDILEKREWSVSGYTDDGRVELEWWSPAGEDFLVCVNVENFPDEILDYSDDFDPDEHIEMWVEARANGRQDVPGARRLAKDAEDIDRPAWGYIEYTAPLDQQQVSDYELVQAPQEADHE